MPPNISGATPRIDEDKSEDRDALGLPAKIKAQKVEDQESEPKKAHRFKIEKNIRTVSYFQQDLKWFNIVAISILNLTALYCFITYPFSEKKATLLFGEHRKIHKILKAK